MKMTLEQARKLALANGASLEIGGRVFNAGMSRVSSAPAQRQVEPEVVKPELAPQPVPSSEESITRAELEQLLAERDKFWMAEMQRLTTMISSAIAAQVPQASAPVAWTFTPKYDERNVLQKIEAAPRIVRH